MVGEVALSAQNWNSNSHGPRRFAGSTEKIQTIPEILRASLTWDQGIEMRDWKQVSVAADIDIYFCDPHSPWQRGTNENTNGLLRQYFPKWHQPLPPQPDRP
jgi:IS30 family transposase